MKHTTHITSYSYRKTLKTLRELSHYYRALGQPDVAKGIAIAIRFFTIARKVPW